MELLLDFNKNYNKIIEPYINYGENFNSIKNIIKNNLNIDLNLYRYDLVERKTEKGFKMNYHRDNYLIRKFNNKKIFIAYDKCPLPKYSLIYYKNDNFVGGELEFLNGLKLNPKKNLFVFFDSNDIHKVNEQKNGIRKVELYKFYD